MKTPILPNHGFNRILRSSVVALLAGSLSLATGFAQSSSGSGTDTSTGGTGSTSTGSGSDTDTSWRSDTGTTGSATDTTGAGAGSRMSANSSRDTEASSSLKRSEKKFITKVAKSTPKEIAMAQLAVERASNPQVKTYAQQIISDHQQMSQQLVQLAEQKGIELENQAQLTSGSSTLYSSSTGSDQNRATGTSTTSGLSSDTGTSASSATGSSAGMTASTSATGSSTSTLPESITSDRHYRNLSEKSGAEFDKEFVSMMVEDHKKDLKLFQEQAEDAEDSEIRSFASQHAPVLQGHLDRAQTLNQSVAE